MFTDKNVSGKVLDHLGLVAATIEKLGLIEKIDQRLPLANPKTTMGQRVAAMIFNGLGFIDDRLYMFPEFLENKPVDRLFKGNLKAEHFNDDALGRCLDAIDDYGVTKLFSELALTIGIEQKLLGRTFNIDSTTLSVYGDYEEDDESLEETQETNITPEKVESPDPSAQAKPRYGYSKNHRGDLKQMILNLATTGKAGFPIWMEAHSGNASDKKILHQAAQRMKDLCKSIKDAPSFMTVGDSAIYDACLKGKDSDMLWLTRVPEYHKAAKQLLQYPDETYIWVKLSDGYKICSTQTTYKEVNQRWVVIYSEQAYQKECKTLEKRIQKMEESLQTALWHLGNQVFQCEKDACKSLQVFHKQFTHHILSAKVEPLYQYQGRGRPSEGSKSSVVGYKVVGTFTKDESKILEERNTKGRFILATNQLDKNILPDEEILFEYKKQSKTESGFKFIKDNAFEVSSIFLKKPGRIAALMMVMTLCLMVYGVSQYNLRCALEAAQDTLPSQTKKATAKPSMKWVYRMFHGVHLVKFTFQEITQEIVINLKDVHKKIIVYFGQIAMDIYGII